MAWTFFGKSIYQHLSGWLTSSSAHILLRPPASQISSRGSQLGASLEEPLLPRPPMEFRVTSLNLQETTDIVLSKTLLQSLLQVLLLLSPESSLIPSRVPEGTMSKMSRFEI